MKREEGGNRQTEMLYRRWRSRQRKTVEISICVATVAGHVPLVGRDVEAAWRKLKERHGIVDGDRSLTKTLSGTQLNVHRSATEIRDRFRTIQAAASDDSTNVYSSNWRPPKYDRTSTDYGRPKKGTLTELRALKAAAHIAREMVQLCEVIEENGYRLADGSMEINFGDLFRIYQFISDKLVGMLLRARKHGMLQFDGEMLYQRRDEEKTIHLLMDADQRRNFLATGLTW